MVLADLFHPYLAEVAGHIRQQVSARIADLVEQLFAHRRATHQAASAWHLADGEAAVGLDLRDRITDMGPVGNALPVGEQSARGLTTALENVADQTAASELIVLVHRPAKVVDQRTQGHGTVDAAPGDHHIGARR